jgi:hypothetical protein
MHEEGRCYHCGIFADKYPEDHPCIREFGENTRDKLMWAGEDRGWIND